MAEEQRKRWKKIGGGSFRMANGKIIKQNQIFEAAEADIPRAFRDVVVPYDQPAEETPLPVVQTGYQVISRGPGWYDVIDGQGKRVNEQALRQDAAKKLVENLSG